MFQRVHLLNLTRPLSDANITDAYITNFESSLT